MFLVAGILSSIYRVSDWGSSLPLVIFYFVLVFNTFFSIRLFSQISPRGEKSQFVIDGILFIAYLFLALNLNSLEGFLIFGLILFIMATIKYAFLLNITSHEGLMKRKIIVDLLGVLAFALALGGVELGFPRTSSWLLAVVFTIANVLLFSVFPLYRLDREVNRSLSS